MTFEEAVEKFVESPCRLTTGVPSLAKRWDIDLDTLYAAKASAKDILKNKEQFGTEYNPSDIALRNLEEINNLYLPNIEDKIIEDLSFKGGTLVKKWGREGKWNFSYDYSKKETSQINFEEILSKVFNSPEKVPVEVCNVPQNSSEYCLNTYLADQHIGASVEHSLYSNYFDKRVYVDRMNKVFSEIVTKAQLFKFKTINVFFLGDTFDGQDGFTVKRTHNLPQNMSNAECFEVGLHTNKVFLERLFNSGLAENYNVFFVRESNHGGDMDLYLFQSLKMWIETCYKQNVTARIAHSFIDHVKIGERTFIYTHGKDNKDMKNGLPLNLDPKTEVFINQYIYEKNIQGNISVVKADLHQDALNVSKLFDYRNVLSLFGSSKWIMSNYGLTEPGVSYDIFNLKTPEIIRGTIQFKI